MQTILKLSPQELNADLLKKLRAFLTHFDSPSITITIEEKDDYLQTLRRSVGQVEKGENLVTLNLEELLNYSPKE